MMTPQQQFQVYKDAYKKAIPTVNQPKQQAAPQQPKATTPAPKK